MLATSMIMYLHRYKSFVFLLKFIQGKFFWASEVSNNTFKSAKGIKILKTVEFADLAEKNLKRMKVVKFSRALVE